MKDHPKPIGDLLNADSLGMTLSLPMTRRDVLRVGLFSAAGLLFPSGRVFGTNADTATAQALSGLPPADPFAATATAAVLMGMVPPADPFAATLTAEALSGPASPLEAPVPSADAMLPPGIAVLTVTATATTELAAGPTQRPIADLPSHAPGDAGAVFRSITGGAFWSLAIIGVLTGGVLFLLLMGAVAGFSIAGPARNQYDLVDTSAGADATLPTTKAPSIGPDGAPPVADNTEWPDTLP